MRADPKTGTESYVQGYSPDIEFLDEAMVSKTGERVCVPASCYDDALVIDEWSPLDPTSGHQLKYYAKGIGNVQIAPVGGDARETLNLTSITQISPEALAQAREAVLALDRRAYDVAPDIWGDTPRADRPRRAHHARSPNRHGGRRIRRSSSSSARVSQACSAAACSASTSASAVPVRARTSRSAPAERHRLHQVGAPAIQRLQPLLRLPEQAAHGRRGSARGPHAGPRRTHEPAAPRSPGPGCPPGHRRSGRARPARDPAARRPLSQRA